MPVRPAASASAFCSESRSEGCFQKKTSCYGRRFVMALPRKICVGCRGSDQGYFDGGSVKEVVWEIDEEVILVHIAEQGVDAIVPLDL